MCILSDTSIQELLIPKEEYETAREWFKERDWDSISGRILIHPYDPKNLGPFNYDLTVGEEVFALGSQQKISIVDEKKVIIKPGDAFLILTQEYIGLPRKFAASVMPRFCLVREGIFQSMTKIDPTWYGRIAVCIINHSGKHYQLEKNQAFCALVIHELKKHCYKVLNPSNSPALGKESIEYFLETRVKK